MISSVSKIVCTVMFMEAQLIVCTLGFETRVFLVQVKELAREIESTVGHAIEGHRGTEFRVRGCVLGGLVEWISMSPMSQLQHGVDSS